MQRCTVTGMYSHCYSPSFCIPGCASTQKVLGKGLGEDGSKRHIKHKIKNISTKRNAPSKIKNIGNSTQKNPCISAKEEIVNIPKTNTMAVHLFIVKAEILKLREVWDMFEVQRKNT